MKINFGYETQKNNKKMRQILLFFIVPKRQIMENDNNNKMYKITAERCTCIGFIVYSFLCGIRSPSHNHLSKNLSQVQPMKYIFDDI